MRANGITANDVASRIGLDAYGIGVLLDMGFSDRPRVAARRSLRAGQDGSLSAHRQNDPGQHEFRRRRLLRTDALPPRVGGEQSAEGTCTFRRLADLYPGITRLPEPARTSWYTFDHFYSTRAYAAALPLVFARRPRHILDIGGNTGLWALACTSHNDQVHVTIVDLPEQVLAAREQLRTSPYRSRIDVCAVDLLDNESEFAERRGR